MDSAIAPGGRNALGFDVNRDLAYRLDLTNGHTGKPIRVGHAPVAAAFTPDGRTAYVADAGTAAYAGTPLPPGHGPLGNRPSSSITPIDLRTGRAEAPIHVCQGPIAVALSAPAHRLVVACGHRVALVDSATRTLVRTINVGGDHRGIIVIAPSGAVAVLGETQIGHGAIPSGDVVSINLRTGDAGRPISISGGCGALALSFAPGSDRYLYATTGLPAGKDRAATRRIVRRVDLIKRTASAPLTSGGHLLSAIHVWPDGHVGCLAPIPTKAAPDLYHVASSLTDPGRDVRLNENPGVVTNFAAQAPYLIATYHFSRQIKVVNLATGASRTVVLKFYADEVLIG